MAETGSKEKYKNTKISIKRETAELIDRLRIKSGLSRAETVEKLAAGAKFMERPSMDLTSIRYEFDHIRNVIEQIAHMCFSNEAAGVKELEEIRDQLKSIDEKISALEGLWCIRK